MVPVASVAKAFCFGMGQAGQQRLTQISPPASRQKAVLKETWYDLAASEGASIRLGVAWLARCSTSVLVR